LKEGETMNAVNLYREQQLAISAAIDSGDYGKASDLLRQDLQKFAQSPTESAQTGHNQTLTRRAKCGIIKAIRRHVRRWKRKQEEKTMKTYTRYEHAGYDIYVSDDKNRVHHAVKIDTTNPTTLYPYEPCKTGGLDNCCDCYTLQQVKNRMKTGKIVFR
jgi:hypothetical protein